MVNLNLGNLSLHKPQDVPTSSIQTKQMHIIPRHAQTATALTQSSRCPKNIVEQLHVRYTYMFNSMKERKCGKCFKDNISSSS